LCLVTARAAEQVLEKMRETGVDFFLDVHMDEAPGPLAERSRERCPDRELRSPSCPWVQGLPFHFIAGSEGSPRFAPAGQMLDDRTSALHGAYVGAYARADPGFQVEKYFPAMARPGPGPTSDVPVG